jgi:hypothetical protein
MEMPDDSRDLIEVALADVQSLESSAESGELAAVVLSLQEALLTVQASIGECQRKTPYSGMRIILRPDGTIQWCCNHAPEHCTNA